MTYSTEITQQVLDQVTHVSDVVIEQDIHDNLIDEYRMKQEVKGYRLLADAQRGTSKGKMAQFRYDTKVSLLKEIREFTNFLQAILNARQTKKQWEGLK